MKAQKRQAKNWLVSCALERQRLGLSRAEYDAMTPFEIACELEAREILEAQRRMCLEVFDEHMARVSLMLNGYQFPNLKGVADFRLVGRKKAQKGGKGGASELAAAFALKREKEKREFLKKRAEIRKRRAEENGN